MTDVLGEARCSYLKAENHVVLLKNGVFQRGWCLMELAYRIQVLIPLIRCLEPFPIFPYVLHGNFFHEHLPYVTATMWQALLSLGVELDDLAACIADRDRRLSQLVIVQGRSDLAFDLFCNQRDTFLGMTAFLAADLEKIRNEILKTFGSKERFNLVIRAYIDATTENYRKTVRYLYLTSTVRGCPEGVCISEDNAIL